MNVNVRKLRGRIREYYDTQADFAVAMGKSPATLSQKLNGKVDFDRKEIETICNLLHIPAVDIPVYFFD